MSDARAHIIQTTSQLLEKQGYHGTGLNEIIRESGAPKGSLYYYFPDGKEQITAEAVLQSGRMVSERIRDGLVASNSPAKAIYEFILLIAENVEQSGFAAGSPLTAVAMETATQSERINLACREAYGMLQSEVGVHRLVRISPFDSAARRHTSFASVDVVPEIDDTIEIEIADKDLKIDIFRASGGGGQHVNRTESAVRMTHLPSGIVVQCQNERSQHKNRDTAMHLLRARLYQLEIEKRKEEQAKLEGEKKDIGFGSQIRSYVLQPYQLVKDLRTGYEVGDPSRILDGDLDGLIEAYLAAQARKSAD